MIYLDHAATTAVDPRVLETMLPYFTEAYGNPNSIYSLGRLARQAIDSARESIAAQLGCRATEIVFTSGGSESDNLAIKGRAIAARRRGRHIVTSAVEHKAVLESCHCLERQGYEVTYVGVDRFGEVAPEAVRAAIRDDTVLVSVMHGNNEVGTLQPVAEIGAVARARGVTFHVDAVQTVGQMPVRVDDLNCDLLSVSGHKLYGPKGVGVLYVRRGIRLAPLIDGGEQEKNRRSGTENVPGAVGLARALELAEEFLHDGTIDRVRRLRDRLIAGIPQRLPDVTLNGHPTRRLPNNVSFCLHHIEGEGMLLGLDEAGICASSGSACSSGSLDPSHVLLAMGVPREIALGALRLTLGHENTDADVDRLLDVLPQVVERLRRLSPTYAVHPRSATAAARSETRPPGVTAPDPVARVGRRSLLS